MGGKRRTRVETFLSFEVVQMTQFEVFVQDASHLYHEVKEGHS